MSNGNLKFGLKKSLVSQNSKSKIALYIQGKQDFDEAFSNWKSQSKEQSLQYSAYDKFLSPKVKKVDSILKNSKTGLNSTTNKKAKNITIEVEDTSKQTKEIQTKK